MAEHRAPRANGRQKGQAVIEFAMAVGVMMLLVVGLFDLGRAVAAYSAVSHAAREGARAALYVSYGDNQIRNAVRSEAVALPGLSDGDIVITPDESHRHAGDTVTVRVNYRFQAATPMIDRFLPAGGLALTAAGTAVVQ